MESIKTNISIIKRRDVKIEKKLQAVNELFLRGGKKAVPDLIKEVINPDWKIRWLIVCSLVYIGEDALPELHKALKHKNWRMRGGIVETLSVIKSKKSIPHLKELLKDKNEKVRRYAKLSLDRFGIKNVSVDDLK